MVVVIINTIVCMFFEYVVVIEKKHSVNDESMGMFIKITIIQFINIGLIVLLVNFH